MHTLRVVIGGVMLLGVFLLAGRIFGHSATRVARAAYFFVPIWFVASVVNLRVGISHAGYTLLAELPIMLVVFCVPALMAVMIGWRISKAQ